MKIDLKHIEGCINLEHKAKRCMYGAVNKGQWWTRLTGIPLGVASGALTIATRVATIGECIVKGSVNIVGSAWRDDCKLWRGLKQLFLSSTKSIIILPFSVFSAATGMFTKTVFMLVIPKRYANNLIQRHSIDHLHNQIDAVLKGTLQGVKMKLLFSNVLANQPATLRDASLHSSLSSLWHPLSKLYEEMERSEQKSEDKVIIYAAMATACREAPEGFEIISNVLNNPQTNFRANVLVLIRLESLYIKFFLTEIQEAVTLENELNEKIRHCKDEAHNTSFDSYQERFETNRIKQLREKYDNLVVEIRKACPEGDVQKAFDNYSRKMKTLRKLTEILSATLEDPPGNQPKVEVFPLGTHTKRADH